MPVEIPVHFVYSQYTVLYHRFIEAYLFLISLRFTATIIIITILNFSLPLCHCNYMVVTTSGNPMTYNLKYLSTFGSTMTLQLNVV